MISFSQGLSALVIVLPLLSHGQEDQVLLNADEHYVMGDAGEDPSPELHAYEEMNKALGGDSVRHCGGHPCIGWVEDRYPDGTLKHRGNYENGQLLIYKNYHPSGALERDFRSIDAVKSILRTYHPNGNLRSEARYADGVVTSYQDNYVNGQLRYAEERDRRESYFIRMDLFTATGEPVSLFQLVDRKLLEFELKEYHPGGVLRSTGRARYDRSRMDTQRIGVWRHYDVAGSLVKEEHYMDGKVASVD
jgi:antitoxin component YwqK of YwqJK toxin-antitoxin module